MSIQNLQRQLNHSEPKTRQDALTQILNLGNHEAYGLLMFTATNHFSPDTRREAKKFSLLLQKRLFSQVSTPQDSDLSPEEEKAFEDFKGAGKIFKADTIQLRCPIKIALTTHLGPG